ncbi:hypothetical protein MGN70_000039 [Eutypa lata]|nr:hypothetical protein MGN70_000039 [Eutypa lata]
MAPQKTLPSICSLCNGLEKKKDEDVRLALEFRPEELLHSVEIDGCSSCALILDAVTRFGEAQLLDSRPLAWSLVDDIARVYVYGLSTARDTLSLEIYFRSEKPKRILELFYPEQGSNVGYHTKRGSFINVNLKSAIHINSIKTRPSISDHPLSQNGLKWVNDKLQTCLSKHSLCPRGRKTALPKRILALQPSPSGDVSVRLLENSKMTAEYATLSHRWGSHQRCITTKATLDKHKNGISWSEIPQTFRDSIQFCLAIDIRYLWIDALCIVQDDAADWQKEAAVMADIYQNSHITLAATSSSSGSAGCFPHDQHSKLEYSLDEESVLMRRQKKRPRSLLGQTTSCLLSFFSKATSRRSPIIRVREKAHHWEGHVSEQTMRLHPLLTRGWVFQERILSSRVLHFCAEEMIWECNTDMVCECGGLSDSKNPRELFNDIVVDSDILPESRAQASTPKGALLPELLTLPASYIKYHLLNFGDRSEDNMPDHEPDPADSVELPGENRSRPVSVSSITPSRLSAEETFGKFPARILGESPGEGYFQRIFQRVTGGPSADSESLLPYSIDKWLFEVQNKQPVSSRQWQAIVGQYSSLQLSKETDRLPALSGLANRASPHLGRYLAGLWSTTFPSDLTWRVRALKNGPRQVIDENRGPSWSWTSIDGAVSYWSDLRIEVTRPEVIPWLLYKPTWKSWSVESRGENPFGEVTSGEVVVGGFIRVVRLQYVWTRPWLTNDPRESVQDHLKYEIAFTSSLELPFFADYILSEEGPNHIADSAELHLLLIHPDVCLVLQSLSQVEAKFSTYRRVGIVRQPEAFASVYNGGVNWMAQSVRDIIRII